MRVSPKEWLGALGGAALALTPLELLAQAPAAGGATPAPAAAAPAPRSMMGEVISTYGHKVDHLFFVILGITTFMLVLVFALFIWFCIRYRHQEGRRSKYTHGNNKLEWFWTTATAAILIWLVFAQRETWNEIKQRDLGSLDNAYRVRVFGEQFVWHFIYPGPDGTFEPSDDTRIFQGSNPVGLKDPKADKYASSLMVPAGVPVIVQLVSLGKYDQDTQKSTLPVLHSFFQPNVRIKQDLVPFHPGELWFQILPDKLGKYEIACAELCGLGHYTMRADMEVLSDAELQARLGYDWKAAPAKKF